MSKLSIFMHILDTATIVVGFVTIQIQANRIKKLETFLASLISPQGGK